MTVALWLMFMAVLIQIAVVNLYLRDILRELRRR